MTENFKSVLENILKKDERLVDDSGELNGNLIHEYANSLDEGLIDLLLNEDATREKFFLKVKDVYVFKQNDFKFFLDENKIDNSYTQYANRIGLSTGGKFLKDIDDIVLDFPYKDCVLEGGQSTEEGTDTYFEYDGNEQDYIEKEAKRKEIFFNQILAKDEIDRLTEPKAFTNIKRYTEKGEEKITSFNRDAKKQITDNLIIKGNNLLALHTLKEQFQGKIKLIYIDPPYNTGNDEFAYNDRFSYSTWMTFMKNRLEVSKLLLDSGGILIAQISDIHVSRLRILMDEVYGKENFINKVSVKTRSPSGFKTVNLGVFETAEYLLIYGKNKTQWKYNPQYVESEYDTNYKYEIKNLEDDPTNWAYQNIEDIIAKQLGFDSPRKAKKEIGKNVFIQKMADYAIDNSQKIFRFTEINNDAGKETLKAKAKSKKQPDKVIIVERDGNSARYVLNGGEIAFYSKKIREINGEKVPTILLTNIWTDIPWEGIAKEGGVKLKRGKKPEKLIRRIIDMATNPGDIVMDFFSGSGTTCAVAHKMQRQYIGIEQLDYGDNDTFIRLNNVIKGDTSGVSKFVNWKGGGSFINCELAKNNQKAIDKIMSCKSLKELITLFDELYEKYFLNYNVKVSDFKEKIVKEKEFQKLTLDRQKEIFARMLDLNQLYVNVSDMEDSRFNLSDEDISLTKNFYQL
jgi:adenine-specific DNA-methyltransferase